MLVLSEYCKSENSSRELQQLETEQQEERMVSVFEGQLTRTWSYINNEKKSDIILSSGQRKPDKKHIINLYHDTITGETSELKCFLFLFLILLAFYPCSSLQYSVLYCLFLYNLIINVVTKYCVISSSEMI